MLNVRFIWLSLATSGVFHLKFSAVAAAGVLFSVAFSYFVYVWSRVRANDFPFHFIIITVTQLTVLSGILWSCYRVVVLP